MLPYPGSTNIFPLITGCVYFSSQITPHIFPYGYPEEKVMKQTEGQWCVCERNLTTPHLDQESLRSSLPMNPSSLCVCLQVD